MRRITWLGVQEQRSTRADEDGNVAKRRVQVYRASAGRRAHDCVGVPVTPGDLSATRKEACSRGIGINEV